MLTPREILKVLRLVRAQYDNEGDIDIVDHCIEEMQKLIKKKRETRWPPSKAAYV